MPIILISIILGDKQITYYIAILSHILILFSIVNEHKNYIKQRKDKNKITDHFDGTFHHDSLTLITLKSILEIGLMTISPAQVTPQVQLQMA